MAGAPDSPVFADYDAFWLHYLRVHRRPATRRLHYCGSLLGVACVAAGALTADWRFLVAAPIVCYGCAWVAHFVLEGNRPATFGRPAWSFVSDFRMLGLALSGRLGRHLVRAEAPQSAEPAV